VLLDVYSGDYPITVIDPNNPDNIVLCDGRVLYVYPYEPQMSSSSFSISAYLPFGLDLPFDDTAPF
jgi:hypothetical protein